MLYDSMSTRKIVIIIANFSILLRATSVFISVKFESVKVEAVIIKINRAPILSSY